MDQRVTNKRNNKPVIIVAVILGVLVSMVACVGGLVMLTLGEDQPLTEEDRALLITPRTLGDAFGHDLQARPDLYHYSKNKSFGITTLTMEYDSPEGAELPLYINHEITYEPSVEDARDTFNISRVVLNQGVEILVGPGAQYVDANHLYSCCDESLSQIFQLRDEETGAPFEAGHLFIMRAGAITMTLLYVGPVFHDPEQWRNLLEPTFAAIVRARHDQ